MFEAEDEDDLYGHVNTFDGEILLERYCHGYIDSKYPITVINIYKELDADGIYYYDKNDPVNVVS